MFRQFVIEGDDGLTLIDAGYPDKQAAVFGAIRRLSRSPDQLKHLIFTHSRLDHIGSAAAIVRVTGARTHMHPLDIPIAESGGPFRPLTPAPGLLGRMTCKVFFHPNERVNPIAIDQPLTAGELLPMAGGIEVIHASGHGAGQVALLGDFLDRNRCDEFGLILRYQVRLSCGKALHDRPEGHYGSEPGRL